ncbi:MAG: hypothetical protein H0V12_12070, partial [Chloroflexi bacterium]|nr:hypothetical protein [Chloroflexota bacterium]
MHPPRAGEADRGHRASGRSGRAPAVAPALVTLLLAGLALRVIIAYVLFPGSGFGSDLSSFTSWALTMAEVGPGAFYGSVSFADYPPGYLYVLWIVGLVAQALSPLAGGDTVGLATALIKVPPMLADLGVALLIHRLALLGLPNVRRRETLAVVAAALYLFNPVTAYDSALWGQTDAVGALVMLAAVAALIRGHSEGAAVLAVVAGLVKPQFGVVLAPLVGVVLLRRHLLLPGSGPRPSRIPGALRGWLIEEQGAWRLVSSATAALLALLLLITPFALDVPGFLELMARTAGGYEWLSVNAYNPWAL